jgi:hypothetical protein
LGQLDIVRTASTRSRTGEWALLIYSLATYLPQLLLHLLRPGALSERFNMSEATAYLAVLVPLFVLLVFFLHWLLPRIEVPMRWLWSLIGRAFESRLNTLFALAIMALAISFMLNDGLSFRHRGALLSEAGLSVEILMFSKPYISAWIIYHILLTIRNAHPRPRLARAQGALYVCALALSLTGSLDALPILWGLLFVLWGPVRLRGFFVGGDGQRARFVSALKLLLAAPFLAAVAIGIIAIGLINKIGTDGTRELIDRIGIATIAEQIMVRVSSSYASTISFAEHRLGDLSFYEKVVAIPVENIPYRLSLVANDPLPRPDITQVTRLNYLSYELDTHLDRAGASPGLVASALYAAPLPLGFVLLAIYSVAVIRFINLPFDSQPDKPRLAAAIFATSSVYPLFESPVDYLILLDPALLQLLFVVAAFVASSIRQQSVVARSFTTGTQCGDTPQHLSGTRHSP